MSEPELPRCLGARSPITLRALGLCIGCPLQSGTGSDIEPPAYRTAAGSWVCQARDDALRGAKESTHVSP
jgi:hypothetical protein